MVWWVKGLMNHPILKAITNVDLLHTGKERIGSVNVAQNAKLHIGSQGIGVKHQNRIHSNGNMSLLLLGMQYGKGKASQRELKHVGQTRQ